MVILELDTFVFCEETKSFKIVEYKNVKNHSMIDKEDIYDSSNVEPLVKQSINVNKKQI